MQSASIKITNLHYFDALQQLALSNLDELHSRPKLLQLPFYNFVCTFVDILTQFSTTQHFNQEDEYEIFNFNSFLVDFYFRKFQDSHSEIYRQLFSFIRSWKKYTDHHEEAKLFASLLTSERNTGQAIKQFLKLRKCILKTMNQKILQQLTLTHQDALTITHTLFSQNCDFKSFVTKKINQMFISLKKKLVNSAKLNGAVMCQFFMACRQRYAQLNVNHLFEQSKTPKNKLITHSQNKKVNRTNPLKQKQQNYLQNRENPQNRKDYHKYNLSFSEQFASYYSPNEGQLRPQGQADSAKLQNESKFLSNFQDLQNQWRMKNCESQAPINLVRNSLTFFRQKDKQIDEKIINCKKHKENHNIYSKSKKEHIRTKQNVIYPQGWDNFMRTNEITKKKLMSKRLPSNFQEIL